MKRILFAILLFLAPAICLGQTTVNLTVTDTPDNQTWNNGTWTVKLIGTTPGQTSPFNILSGGGSLAVQSGSLSTTGTASMSLPANSNIAPTSIWQYVVCSQAGTACFIQNVTVVTSSPQTLTIAPPSIRVSAQPNLPPVVVYTTTEVSIASLGAQITVVGTTPTTPSLQSCQVVSGNSCTTWTAVGSSTSPSSLTTFFNQYQGLSPLDCSNATCTSQDLNAGNGREFYDGVLSSGSAVVTSASANFCNGGAVACSGLESNGQTKTTDVGRQFEAVCSGNSVGALTVASVQSATQITLSATQSTCNAGSVQIFIGSDNTATLQNWITNGMTVNHAHNFYLPKGLYYTTKPLVFDNTTNAGLNNKECSAHVNPNAPITCGLILKGAGAAASMIHPATQPNFNWTINSASAEGIVRVKNFSFGEITGVAVNGDQVVYATTVSNTCAGLYMDVGNAHFEVHSIWVNRIGCGGANINTGVEDVGCFECSWHDNAIEGNRLQNATFTLAEKETIGPNNFFESGSLTTNNVVLGASGLAQSRFYNNHFQGAGAANVAQIFFSAGFTIATGHSIEFENIRMDGGSTTDVGIWVANCSGGTVEINNSNLINANNNASVRLIRSDATNSCPIIINGGVLSPGGASSLAVLNNGTGGIWMQTVNCLNGCAISGTGVTNQLLQTATGWGGSGGITGSYFGSDFTGATTPTLSAGTGACATTSTQVGGSWAGTFICTGTAGAGTITIAPGTTATHGWNCTINDNTSGVIGSQSGSSTTTCVMKITTAANTDVIGFTAWRF